MDLATAEVTFGGSTAVVRGRWVEGSPPVRAVAARLGHGDSTVALQV